MKNLLIWTLIFAVAANLALTAYLISCIETLSEDVDSVYSYVGQVHDDLHSMDSDVREKLEDAEQYHHSHY